MANYIISVHNDKAGTIAVDTVNGLVSLDPQDTATGLEVTAAQLAAVKALASVVVTGDSANTTTTFLGISKEADGNTDVVNQTTLNLGLDKIDTFASLISKALQGDMQIVISPTTVSKAAAEIAGTRTVTITLKTAGGVTHTWYNGTFDVATTKSSSAGTATSATTAVAASGVATVTITRGGTWAENDTNTLTVSAEVIAGVSVTGGTSVETATA